MSAYQNYIRFEDLVSPPYELKDIAEAVNEAQKQNWMRVSVKP